MPARRSTISKFRHHKATGQALVVIDGKSIYLGKYDTAEARERYDRVVAEWLCNGRCAARDVRGLTVAEAILAYWEFAQSYYRKNGQPTDELYSIRAAMRPLRRVYAALPVADFGPLKLKVVRQAMINAGRSRSYINGSVNRIKRMFKWAVENELVAPSVYQGLQAVAGLRRGRSEARETEPVKPVPDPFVDAVRPHVSRQVWAMIELQRLAGLRSGEVVIMQACDIDMSGTVWHYSPGRHKTEHRGRIRIIELGPRAQQVIRPFLKPEPGAFLFSPIEAEVERAVERRKRRRTPVQPSQRNRRKRNAKRRPGVNAG